MVDSSKSKAKSQYYREEAFDPSIDLPNWVDEATVTSTNYADVYDRTKGKDAGEESE